MKNKTLQRMWLIASLGLAPLFLQTNSTIAKDPVVVESPEIDIRSMSMVTTSFLTLEEFEASFVKEEEIVEEPIEEVVVIEEEIIEEPPVVEEVVDIAEEPLATEYEINLIAMMVWGECGLEPELGQRLVIDTVLNRVDSDIYPNTIHEVIWQKSQYKAMKRTDLIVTEDIRKLVIEELENRTNYDVMCFRTKHYHTWGTPIMQVCCHYFSSL